MTIDILHALPPDTAITGCIGDRGWYRRFEATASTAREVAGQTYSELVMISAGSHDPPPSFHDREGECCAVLSDDITLVLDCDGDVRSAPWKVRGVRIEGIEIFCWDRDPTALKNAIAQLTTITQQLASLQSAS